MSLCTIINAHVTDQVIQLSNLPRIASGSKNALQINCTFCGKWEGCGKSAVFYRTEAEVFHVPVVNGLVTVPWEVLVDEGYFWLGFMGQDDLTRTTEAIRIEVAKGALTVATATPQEPTPDIYQQIMARHATLEARFNAAIAVPGSNANPSYTAKSSDGLVTANIKSNGYTAQIGIRIDESFSGMYNSSGDNWYETDFMIPPAYAPITSLYLYDNNFPGCRIILSDGAEDAANGGTGAAQVIVTGAVDGPAIDILAEGTYAIAKPSLPELTNIREDYKGTRYETAGAAVRAQAEDVIAQVEQIGEVITQIGEEYITPLEQNVANITDQVNAMDEDVADILRRLVALEKGGGGGITVEDDGAGNVTITASAGVSITDDGNGNVTIM